MKSDQAQEFDNAIETVILDDTWAHGEKVRFIVECLEDMLMDGWDNYPESGFYLYEEMQDAINTL